MPDAATIRDVSEAVRTVELAWIPMPDGRRLAARLWLPADAEARPVPAILEYIPYRRRDGTRGRDDEAHAWVAAQGYGCARVDIAGSGDSDGLLRDEYLPQEQADAVAIIAWLAAQPWCSGAVGMIGISWGGFNGLQVAALQPPALKAVVSLCSTVDRYADDVHFMGGCLLNDNFDWGGAFFAYAALPPDPEMVGPSWLERWLERLEAVQPFPALWFAHQRRDAFWRHGSVCEDWSKLTCPVLAVSGWADGYTAAVFRLVETMPGPCKGIVGPWGHLYPFRGVPGPAIGFLQECVRWWDRWLKGVRNGVDDDPALRLWLQESVPPQAHYDERPGRWIALPGWPAAAVERRRLALNADGLAEAAGPAAPLALRSPQTTGVAGGEWCAYGLGKVAPEMPLDQRIDDAGSLVFDGPPLDRPLAIVGDPAVTLEVASDRPQAMVAVRLSDVAPDGAATRISFGLLNLSHRDSDAEPEALEPGRSYVVRVRLNEAAWRVPAGHRLRVAVSSAYWPMVWPQPEAATLTVTAGRSALELPVLPAAAEAGWSSFGPVEHATPMARTVFDPGAEHRTLVYDVDRDRTTFRVSRNDGRSRIDAIGTEIAYTKLKQFSIERDDPRTARSEVETMIHYRREADGWDARLVARIVMTTDGRDLIIDSDIDAFAGQRRVLARAYHHRIPRDHQ
jgi:putative CocE/NonD family hydrolase